MNTPIPTSPEEAIAEIRKAMEALRGVKIMVAAGQFDDFAGEPWLSRVLEVRPIDALLAEIDSLRADARRYQCIRNAPYSDNHGDLYAMTFQGDGDYPVKGEALDVACDAALKAISP